MFKRTFQLAWLVLVGLAFFFPPMPARAADSPGDPPVALILTADGPVTATMADYLVRGLRVASQQHVDLIIFEINTPGGSISLMSQMIENIRSSPIPVVTYVYPNGAMAGSAGTLITLAGHAIAMAPETSIGAASPVDSSGQNLNTTEEQKVKQITEATARSLTERRGPKAMALAVNTIENAQAASATEALDVGLIDFIASDVNDLLRKLDGFKVTTSKGDVVLHTANAQTQELPNTLIEQILQKLTDPNIVFLLLTIGVQAILIELTSPGGWVAGFIGVVMLALAIYGMGVLPVNWFGIIFLIIAFVLFVLDIKAPTHGALTAAGIGSFIVGALVLFNSPGVPSFQRVSVPLVIGMSLVTAALFLTVLVFALRAQKLAIRTGHEAMVFRTGLVKDELNPLGTVQLGGELWTAETAEGEPPIPTGAKVSVEQVSGLRLRVRRVPPANEETSSGTVTKT